MIKEIQGYLTTLNELQDQIKSLLEGLPQEALDWRPIQGEGELATNSLAAVITHLAGSENYFMKEIIGRQPIQRNREAEFVTRGVNVSALKTQLEAAAKSAEEVLSPMTEGQLEEGRKFRDRQVTVRWSILHVIEHTAQHVGHMQLTRQLWLAKSKK
jgi:uncharacterized damage-inducible protein DinB